MKWRERYRRKQGYREHKYEIGNKIKEMNGRSGKILDYDWKKEE